MNATSLSKVLAAVQLGGLRYFDSIGSTNDEALAWAASGAADFSLVAADEQTSGRGRLKRTWHTPAGSALAFSLILRPDAAMRSHLSRVVGLAALALMDALGGREISPKIKWPNDLLLRGKKAAGILVETVWTGAEADAVVVGIGVNVSRSSVPAEKDLRYPATSLEDALTGTTPPREKILFDALSALQYWRKQIHTGEFLEAWEKALAFRGEQVRILNEGQAEQSGELLGLEEDGSLRLRGADGNIFVVRVGDLSLRPNA